MNEQEKPPELRLLVIITDRVECHRLEEIIREKHVHLHYMFHGMGTASSEILKAFGLSGTEKTVWICIEPEPQVRQVMTAVVERLEFTRPGNGIAFTIPLSGISAVILNMLQNTPDKERGGYPMEAQSKRESAEARHELVIAVINKGYSDMLMDAARKAGARGGTIVQARRSAVEDAVKFFGVSLQAEKEIVSILIDRSRKKELMQAITAACGIRTEAHGIVLALPVDSCAGIGEASVADEEI